MRDTQRPVVTPFARALALLTAFTPEARWLGKGELCTRTGLPPTTVSRIAQTLADEGYLMQEEGGRRYRLTPAALTLGYGATANSEVQQLAGPGMQRFADRHKVHVSLSSRDRLDMIVLVSCHSEDSPLAFNLRAGTRLGIASSPMGWALLSALPDLERFYLLENVERRLPREWPRLRRRVHQAIAQAIESGFCASLGEWDRDMGIVAAPLLVEGHAPLALTCVGDSRQITRARVEREMGPQLVAMAADIQRTVASMVASMVASAVAS